MRLLYIICFGILGVLARYFVGLSVAKNIPTAFPLGTFLINISGSFFIGLVYVLGVEKGLISQDLRLGIMVGFLGGFTTFSSYSLEATRLIEQGELSISLAYLLLSPALGLAAAFGGIALARVFTAN